MVIPCTMPSYLIHPCNISGQQVFWCLQEFHQFCLRSLWLIGFVLLFCSFFVFLELLGFFFKFLQIVLQMLLLSFLWIFELDFIVWYLLQYWQFYCWWCYERISFFSQFVFCKFFCLPNYIYSKNIFVTILNVIYFITSLIKYLLFK